MNSVSTTIPPLTIAVISRQHLIWLGLQNMFERAETPPRILMHLHPQMMPDALRVEQQPDVFILDLENERDAVGLIKRIRESAPNSKIVLLGGFEEQEGMREAFAYDVDGVILTVQPPEVVLATIEALYPPGKNRGQAERHETECGGDRKKRSEQKGALETQLPPWPDVVTEREHEVIRLLCQGSLQQRDRLPVVDCRQYGAAPSDEHFRKGRRAQSAEAPDPHASVPRRPLPPIFSRLNSGIQGRSAVRSLTVHPVIFDDPSRGVK